MIEFLPALIGGILIGVAAGLYLNFNGYIMGASGILGGILRGEVRGVHFGQVLFVIGMIIAPLIYGIFAKVPEIEITNNIPLIIAGGLLVGFGSRLGSGCTSGHGVCGLGRFSKRSIVAVIVFMIAAIVTVFVQNHVLG